MNSQRKAPERGAKVSIPGSYLGRCTFYKVREETDGRVAWYVIDPRYRQFHAFRPEQVVIHRAKVVAA